jgi:predicted O-methyltransferase YrrM
MSILKKITNKILDTSFDAATFLCILIGHRKIPDKDTFNIAKSVIKSENHPLFLQVESNPSAKVLANFPPGHFYSPIPDITHVETHREGIFSLDRQVTNLDLNEARQCALFEKLSAHLPEIPFAPEKIPGFRYFFNNPFFSYGDGITLYGILREVPVKRIVEVGSGFSSALMLDVNERFLNNRIDFTFIEPFPDRFEELVGNSSSKHQLIVESVQDVDLDVFSKLEKNDILFIDSSHVGKIGSDFLHILFNILPVLQSGVLIHFHDIFWPFEYPELWVKEGRAWNEIYFLRAFLSHNQDYEIIFFNSFFVEKNRNLVAERAPLMLEKTEFDFNYPNASLWLRKR